MPSLDYSITPDDPAHGEVPLVPLGSGWFLGLRFPAPIEAEFRAHYLRAFRGRMRVLWFAGAFSWLVAAIADAIMFPQAPAVFFVLRYIGLAIILLAAGAVSMPRRFGPSIHLLTAAAGAATGACTAAMFACLPYPQNLYLFVMLAGACIVTTIFVATLHFEYSVCICLVIVPTFAAAALMTPSVSPLVALGLTVILAIISAGSLGCTNIIEQYARKNFAQRRVLEQQSAAIAEKAGQLAISERKAKEANLAKSVFLSNMSHELRTPLNAVLGFAQLMERDPDLSAEGRANLKIIQRSGDHLLALINDVLAISKIESGKVTLNENAFDLRQMIMSVEDMIRVRTESKGLQFLVTIDDEVPAAVSGDEGKLRQILVNLLGNAVKFTDAGGIALRAGWTGAGAVIEIEDTGFGIAKEEIGQLFEAFGQTESGRKSKEGTGLGLAISRNFLRLMGGDIRVTSELDRGTTFTIEVPLSLASDAPVSEAKPRRVAGLADGQPAWRLLVVDDIAENRMLLTKLLTMAGFDVREAVNGRQAIDVWQAWEPHLIWMDIRMPVMDGMEAARHIRELPKGGDCRIIALTASAFHHDRENILSNGCDDFVTKPFREATIFEKLSAHLGARFVYDATGTGDEQAAAATVDAVLLPERLRTLPGPLLASLRTQMMRGDIEAALEAVDEIKSLDEPLANELQRLLRAYRFEDVLDAIE